MRSDYLSLWQSSCRREDLFTGKLFLNILLVFVHRVLQEIAACFNTMHCKRPFYLSDNFLSFLTQESYLLKAAILVL